MRMKPEPQSPTSRSSSSRVTTHAVHTSSVSLSVGGVMFRPCLSVCLSVCLSSYRDNSKSHRWTLWHLGNSSIMDQGRAN